MKHRIVHALQKYVLNPPIKFLNPDRPRNLVKAVVRQDQLIMSEEHLRAEDLEVGYCGLAVLSRRNFDERNG